jgi:hypothetical protein
MGVKLGNGKWAIKEDKLLAYNDNSGRFFNKEFDFSRGSSATYVDKDGLIKTAGLQATNLVNNGDFSELGSELITNGNFDTDSDWSNFGTPTTSEQSTDKAYLGSYSWYVVATAFRQGIFSPNNFSLVNGKTYKASLWIYAVDGAEILSGVTNSDATVFTSRAVTQGQWTNVVYYFTANASSASYISILSSSSTLEFYVDNISVKQVDPNDYWTLGTGWSFGDGKVVFSDTANGDIRTSSSVFTANSKYKINLTVSDLTSGTAFFALGDGASSNLVGYNNYSNGDYSFEITAPNGQELRIYATTSSSSSFSITNISIQEIQADTPRIDFSDSVKGALLLEPSSTQLLQYSEDFSDSSWFLYGTIQANSSSSPDGLTNATKLTHTHQTYNMLRVSVGGLRVTSVFVKNIDANNFYIRKSGGGYAYYNFDTKTVNDNSLKVEYFSNDWVRLSLATDQVTYRQFGIGQREIDSSEVGNSVYVWGAQLEEKSFSTSYIPNHGVSGGVTRLADVCINSGTAQDFNSEEGVLYAEIAALANDGTNRVIAISDTTSSNVVRFYYSTTDNRIVGAVKSGGSSVFFYNHILTDATSFIKIAISFKTDDFKMYVNGTKVSIDTSGNAPIGLSELAFDNGGGLNAFYGKVRELQVFTELLTDEQLEKLTTI